MILGRFVVRAFALRRTRYLATDTRVAVTGGVTGRAVHTSFLASLPPPVMKEREDGSGEIVRPSERGTCSLRGVDQEYTPMMPPEDIERIRRWHEAAYVDGRAAAGTQGRTYEYLGLIMVIPPQVQPIFPVSHLLGEAVLAEVRVGDHVLDMGTGSGVNAILAASRGAEVVAVDINPYALDAARANADRNGVADRVTIRYSDIFDGVDGRFDLIIFDPPFRWFTPRDHLEMASADPNYVGLTAFFRGGRAHLNDSGRMLIFFGTSGDIAYLNVLIDEAGFVRETLATLAGERDGVPVEYVTYCLSVPG